MSKAVKMDEVEVESKPGTYPNLDDIVVEDEGLTLLLPCIVCNKTFKPEVLQRHSKVCEKTVHKKRKTFDSFKQRVQGTDLAEFLPFSSLQKKIPVCEKPLSPSKVSSRWKENHEAFVTAIRAARGEGPDASGGSGDSRSLLRPSDHEQCPYCERHFGRKAFDRHQEWCREQHSRHPPVIASSQAKERLEARIKYRAPPIKSKRAITREKYSPLVQRKVRQVSPSSNSNFSNSTTGSATSSAGSMRHSSQSQQEQSNRLSRSGNSLSGRSQVKDSSSALGFNRGMAGRTSLRASQRATQRPSSPSKRSPASNKLPASPSQISSLDESRGANNREDLTITTSSLKKLQSRNQTTKQHDTKVLESQSLKVQKKPAHAPSLQTMQIEAHSKDLKGNTNNSKSSKHEQLWSGSHQEEPYDPYASAERQMMELLRSDSACNITKKPKQKSPSPSPSAAPSPSPSLSPMPSPTLSPKPSPLETSPTSAFTRYAKEFESDNQADVDLTSKPEVVETDEKYTRRGGESVQNRAPINAPVDAAEKTKFHHGNQLFGVANPNVSLPTPPSAPQPPPRSNKRLASLTQLKNLDDLVVSGVSVPRPQLQSSHSLDLIVKEPSNSVNHDINSRPRTYDIHSHSQKECLEKGGWFNSNDCEQPLLGELEFPPILNSSGETEVEILDLECVDRKARRETRESREVREITEQETGISNIDNLLEEVVRMQHSVSMLSDVESGNVKQTCLLPASQSSARSRRNRTGKMHIEDFLFPAELLERDSKNFRTSNDTSECSSSVFGSTKSRKASSKGRRLIEDMLFPPGLDFNANTEIDKDDCDVAVSSSAHSAIFPCPMELNSKIDFTSRYTSSPVALTSKAPNSNNRSDGLPRPKPMSLSTLSSRNGANEGNEADPTSAPTSPIPMQPSNQSRQSNSSRLSADSAYSSLNRRSPLPQNRRLCPVGVQDLHGRGAESPQSILSQSLTQSMVLSSSGSESSLPPLSVSHSLKRGGRGKHDCDTPSSDIGSATTPLLPKFSKFCHQCGTKFLVTLAKFCHECGAARLEIC